MSEYAKPLPPLDDPIAGPHWAAAREHRFALQECPQCQARRWPPSPTCPECLHAGGEWVDVEPGGRVWGFAVYDRPYRREFKEDLPYNVALIELDAGPNMIASVAGVAPEDLEVGARVTAVFDDLTPEATLVRFAPAVEETG